MNRIQQHYIIAHDFSSRSKGAFHSGGSRCFRASQIKLSRRVTAAAGEVTIRRAHRHAVGSRCLADTTARATGNFEETHTGVEEHFNVTIAQKLLVSLARCYTAHTAYIIIDMTAFEHQRCLRDVAITAIRAATDEHLLHRRGR